MDDRVHLVPLDDLGQALIGAWRGHVSAVKTGIADPTGLAIAEVINHDDLPARLLQGVDHMGANVSAPSCHQNGHFPRLPLKTADAIMFNFEYKCSILFQFEYITETNSLQAMQPPYLGYT